MGLSKTVELSHFYRKFALKGKYIALWISINLLKNRRTLLGLTQQDLTDDTGLSPRIIKSIETGKANPSIGTLGKIADILGLEIIMQVKEIKV